LPAWLLLLVAGFVAAATVLSLRSIDDQPRAAAKPPQPAAAGPPTGTLQGTALAPLLPVPPREGLRRFVGRPALGQGLPVQSINGNEGFWVGSGQRDRVYVEWGGDPGGREAAGFRPSQGDSVDLIGPVQPAPADPARSLRLNAEEAQLVRSQGAYVNATRVVPSRAR